MTYIQRSGIQGQDIPVAWTLELISAAHYFNINGDLSGAANTNEIRFIKPSSPDNGVSIWLTTKTPSLFKHNYAPPIPSGAYPIYCPSNIDLQTVGGQVVELRFSFVGGAGRWTVQSTGGVPPGIHGSTHHHGATDPIALTATDVADAGTLTNNTSGTASNVTGVVLVPNGGSGVSTITGIVKGNGAAAFSAATPGTDYEAPIGTSTTDKFWRGDKTFQRVPGTSVDMYRIAGSTYSTAQHWRNNLSSAGYVAGGTITDAGGGNINVSGGQGILRSSDSNTGDLYFTDWAASNGLAIPSNTVRYIGVEYNAGTPQVTVRTTDNFNYHTDFPLGVVVNEAGTLHVINSDVHFLSDFPTHVLERLEHTYPFARDNRLGGLIIGETGTRNITITGGNVWEKLNKLIVPAFNSSTGGTWDSYYRDGAGGFIKQSPMSQWPNISYDNNLGALSTIDANKYAVLWFYMEPDDGNVIMVYGRGQYPNSAAAETEGTPNTVPSRITEGGMLIGRLIFQKSAGVSTSISSAFNTVFTQTAVTSHNNLSGLQGGALNEYNHLTNAEYTGSGTGTFARTTSPNFTTPNIGNATGNITGTAGNLSGTPPLPNGTTATTQTAGDNSTKLATTAYADTVPSANVVRALAYAWFMA